MRQLILSGKHTQRHTYTHIHNTRRLCRACVVFTWRFSGARHVGETCGVGLRATRNSAKGFYFRICGTRAQHTHKVKHLRGIGASTVTYTLSHLHTYTCTSPVRSLKLLRRLWVKPFTHQWMFGKQYTYIHNLRWRFTLECYAIKHDMLMYSRYD